ncbi:MAG: hypothetical protein IKS21_06425 [Oscillospiraceae bacterium]|nr:hypothetical protein [Oscillospiraceae bacterium]
MNANDFLSALNDADEELIWQAGHSGKHAESEAVWKRPKAVVRALLAAALILALSATVYGVGELIGIWNDRWLQTPASDPLQVVREAILRQVEKDYTISVTVEEILADDLETQKLLAWEPDSVRSMLNGYGAKPKALEGKQPEEVKAVYARYSVVYDHEKTFYRDGTLYQYFYLVRNADGNWEIFEVTDAQVLAPSAGTENVAPSDCEHLTDASEEAPSAPLRSAERDYSAAIQCVTEMIQKWEAFEDVSRVRIDEAAFDPERTEAALQRLRGSTLAAGNGWTEAYLKTHIAAITVTYTYWQDSSPTTETATYWLLQNPVTGEWSNSDITGIMDSAE